jgi:hypothetical protein
VLVRSVDAPRMVDENEPFRVATEIVSNREQTAQFDLFRNAVKVGSQQVKLQKGVNHFETTQSISDTRLTEFTAQIAARQDTLADNNQASTATSPTSRTTSSRRSTRRTWPSTCDRPRARRMTSRICRATISLSSTTCLRPIFRRRR